MKFHSRFLRGGMAALLLSLSYPGGLQALEPRTWLTLSGSTLDAELVRAVGDDIELKDKEGRITKLKKSQLSFGDVDYINENMPPDKSANVLGTKPVVKIPIPGKEAKVDTKAFKKEAGDFKVNDRTYRICETPHFKILYFKPSEPMDIAELAERLWVDTAFFHSTYIQKWRERKMAIMLVNDDEAYTDVGSWYADMISQGIDEKAKENAQNLRKTWPESAAGSVNMLQDLALKHGVFQHMRVFRNYAKDPRDLTGKKTMPIKPGVWDSFRTHCLASDMLGIQAGGVSGFNKDGSFAFFTGHAYFKEIQLTGHSVTSRLGVKGTGKDVTSTGGYTGKDWAPEIKKNVKKGELNPDLDRLFKVEDNAADTKDVVLAYAFSRFLQSTPERLSAFNRLTERVSTSNALPEIGDIAKIYGYETSEAFKAAFVEYIKSPEFR